MLGDQLINGKRCIITVNDLVLYFMIFLCENELFQRGWGVGGGVLWKITEGLGGHQPPYKNGKSRDVAGS